MCVIYIRCSYQLSDKIFTLLLASLVATHQAGIAGAGVATSHVHYSSQPILTHLVPGYHFIEGSCCRFLLENLPPDRCFTITSVLLEPLALFSYSEGNFQLLWNCRNLIHEFGNYNISNDCQYHLDSISTCVTLRVTVNVIHVTVTYDYDPDNFSFSCYKRDNVGNSDINNGADIMLLVFDAIRTNRYAVSYVGDYSISASRSKRDGEDFIYEDTHENVYLSIYASNTIKPRAVE